MLTVAGKHIIQLVTRMHPSVQAEIREREERAAAFDRQFGVDTVGFVYQTELKSDNPNQLHAKRYEGSDPHFFRNAIGALPINYRRFVFVDFGSGKGRAILLATEFPFRKIVGVEFSEELHRIAKENISKFHNPDSKCIDVESVCVDALRYQFPDEPLVCYFGDPFDEALMAKMLGNIQQSLLRAPREIFIVYYNPRSGHLFDQAPCFERVNELGPVKIWRPATNSDRTVE